jgi:hypothetical protein
MDFSTYSMIYLYLRSTEDWANAKPHTITKNWFNKDGLYKFNKAFALDWFEYRRQIKEIAVSMWQFPFIESFESIYDLHDDTWLLPIDDDDWHHPSIKELDKIRLEFDYVCWSSFIVNMVGNHSIHHFQINSASSQEESIASNAYAIRVRFLKKIGIRRLGRKILSAHTTSRHLVYEAGGQILDERPNILSVYNWHLGSISVLNKVMEENGNLRSLLPRNNPVKIERQHKWLEPGYSQIVELTERLGGRRMLLL